MPLETLRRPAEPCSLAAPHELGRHLPRRLVDHLVAEHHGALALALGGRLLVGVEDVPRAVELLLRRREQLVEDVDLVGMQRPLAVVAEHLRALAVVTERVGLADLQERAVDHLEAVRSPRHQDLREHVVEVVARVLGDLHAAGEHRHLHGRGEVGGTEDDGLETGRRRADLLDVDQAAGRLDLRLDADVPGGETRPWSRPGTATGRARSPRLPTAPSGASPLRGGCRPGRPPRSRRTPSTRCPTR